MLSVKYISDPLPEDYCADLKSGPDHAGGAVFASLSHQFTLAEPEADSLWARTADSPGVCD